AEASALRAAFDTVVGDKEGVGEEAWILLETALIDDPRLFRSPVRPISELLAGVGLESDDQYIGPKDPPWTRTGLMAGENFRDMLGGEYELEECCEEALDVAIEAFRAHTHGGHPNPRDVNRALGHGRVWEAFGDWLEEYDDLGGSMVEEFLARLVTAGHRH